MQIIIQTYYDFDGSSAQQVDQGGAPLPAGGGTGGSAQGKVIEKGVKNVVNGAAKTIKKAVSKVPGQLSRGIEFFLQK